MKTWLNNHFGINKGEFNGLLVLIFLIMVLKLIPFVYDHFKKEEALSTELLGQIQQLTIRNAEESPESFSKTASSDYKAARLFKFDPNTLDQAGWEALGLSPKQASSIINYRNKGGKFRKAQDVKRMYTISPAVYERLLPYIEIAPSTDGYSKYTDGAKKQYQKKEALIVDVNLADSAQLDEIKGVGPAFAMRILKYRARLGGFHNKTQLMEVYGLDSIKFREIESQITISSSNLKKINVNTCTFDDLKGNPYLSFKQINAIIQYRKQHGQYSGIEDLRKVAILNPQVMEKIIPYLSF